MLEVGLWLQAVIIQQLIVVEITRYWTGIALLYLPKRDPDNAGNRPAQDIQNKKELEEIG